MARTLEQIVAHSLGELNLRLIGLAAENEALREALDEAKRTMISPPSEE